MLDCHRGGTQKKRHVLEKAATTKEKIVRKQIFRNLQILCKCGSIVVRSNCRSRWYRDLVQYKYGTTYTPNEPNLIEGSAPVVALIVPPCFGVLEHETSYSYTGYSDFLVFMRGKTYNSYENMSSWLSSISTPIQIGSCQMRELTQRNTIPLPGF